MIITLWGVPDPRAAYDDRERGSGATSSREAKLNWDVSASGSISVEGLLETMRASVMRGVLVFLTLSSAPWNRACAQDIPLVLQHVAIIDVIAGRAQPGMTVEIRGRTIAAVSADRGARVPPGASVIDGRGRYLIPGLWDMHVHLSWPPGAAQISLPVMVANGVLGARDMHGTLAAILGLRRAIARGAQVGPRLFVAGPAVDGPNSFLPAARVVRTADEARAAVRELKTAGVDFIKVYSSLPRDLYFAIAGEAK